MKRLLAWMALGAAALLSACSAPDAPSDLPANVSVAPGDTSALVSWDDEDGTDFWVFYAEGTDWTYDNRTTQPGYRSQYVSSPPYLITGLTNGKTYSVIVAKTKDGSAAGPTSAPIAVTPRIAGNEWVVGSPLPVARLNGVTYGNSLFVAVGDAGAVYTSEDAVTWTARASGTASNLYGVAWVSARFVAVGADGTVITSIDGTDWSAANNANTRTLYGITDYGDSAVAVGAGGTILASSSGGLTWYEVASGTASDLYAVTQGNGRLVVAGAGGTMLYADGINEPWQPAASGVTTDLRAVRYGADLFAVVGSGGTALWSTDGTNFSPASVPAVGDLRAVAFGSQFAAVGASGAAMTSLDGKVWTAVSTGTTDALNALTYGWYRFSAVGEAGANLYAQ